MLDWIIVLLLACVATFAFFYLFKNTPVQNSSGSNAVSSKVGKAQQAKQKKAAKGAKDTTPAAAAAAVKATAINVGVISHVVEEENCLLILKSQGKEMPSKKKNAIVAAEKSAEIAKQQKEAKKAKVSQEQKEKNAKKELWEESRDLQMGFIKVSKKNSTTAADRKLKEELKEQKQKEDEETAKKLKEKIESKKQALKEKSNQTPINEQQSLDNVKAFLEKQRKEKAAKAEAQVKRVEGGVVKNFPFKAAEASTPWTSFTAEGEGNGAADNAGFPRL